MSQELLDENTGAESTEDESVQSDVEQTDSEETQAEDTTASEASEEEAEEDVEEEADTTLDEEIEEEEAEVEVIGIPEGTVAPAEAPTDVEYLAVVNSTGLTKYVLPAQEAVENATQGGYSVRAVTEEEEAEYKKANNIE